MPGPLDTYSGLSQITDRATYDALRYLTMGPRPVSRSGRAITVSGLHA